MTVHSDDGGDMESLGGGELIVADVVKCEMSGPTSGRCRVGQNNKLQC